MIQRNIQFTRNFGSTTWNTGKIMNRVQSIGRKTYSDIKKLRMAGGRRRRDNVRLHSSSQNVFFWQDCHRQAAVSLSRTSLTPRIRLWATRKTTSVFTRICACSTVYHFEWVKREIRRCNLSHLFSSRSQRARIPFSYSYDTTVVTVVYHKKLQLDALPLPLLFFFSPFHSRFSISLPPFVLGA